jgi:hypothetical protein
MAGSNALLTRFALLLGLLQGGALCMAQEGYNAIWSGSSGTSPAPSGAYIDALPFLSSTNPDICVTISSILASYYPNPVIIDARGILPSAPGNSNPNYVTCSVNPFVYTNASQQQVATGPATILLPGTNINVAQPWIMPSNTRIIGEGGGPQSYTVLGVYKSLLTSSGGNGTAMIQMGTGGTGQVIGVVIEHLELAGGNPSGFASNGNFDGIDNVNAGDGSYVNDVQFTNIGPMGTGSSPGLGTCGTSTVTNLCISQNATYSGPYTNLSVVPPSPAACSSNMCAATACVKIQAQTRGLHGISCVGPSPKGNPSGPNAAIYLDAYATTIQDVHVEGFQDAIVVGDYKDSQGSTLVVNGGTPSFSGNTIINARAANGQGPVRNTVHICNAAYGTTTGACGSTSTIAVNNYTILQTTNTTAVVATDEAQPIQDDNITWNPYTQSSLGSNEYVGIYAVGSTSPSSTTGPESRFTTMPGNYNSVSTTGHSAGTPTWGVGTTNPSGTACSNSGAIYTYTSGSYGSTNTVFVCSAFKNGSLQWTGIGN